MRDIVTPLQGIGVLVTRPEQQATALCRLLEMQGAHTLRLPAIDIRPLADPRSKARALDAYDFILFTSANAVRYGAALLEPRLGLTLAAMGPATARALNERGYEVTLKPQGGYTSEALLAHLELERLAGQRILLIKGADGRQLLEPELKRRGASVEVVEVYERVPASLSSGDLADALRQFEAGRLQVVTATSVDVGRHLLDIVPEELRRHLEQAIWLVPGERVAAGLRELGLTTRLLMADSAEDQDLVSALVRWRASESGA